MKSLVLFTCLAVATAPLPSRAENLVHDLAGLNAAIAGAQAGDTIILADGTWRDAVIDVGRGGSSSAPLVLRAQTPGQVILSGTSRLAFSAPFVVVDGLRFQGGAPAKGNVVDFKSDDDRLTNCAIVNCNPPAPPAAAEGGKQPRAAAYYYVYFAGNRNRMDHCYLTGKNNPEPVIGNDLKNGRHNTVEACFFKKFPHIDENGHEIFRIWGYGGNEELGPDGAFFTIADNLFEQADGEGQEIISLKSNRNLVRNNTIRDTRGGITNRSGNFNTIDGNFIFGEGRPGAYGLRITGRHHIITHNYIEGCTYGISLLAGEFFERELTPAFKPILREGTVLGRVPAYSQPRAATLAYNTLVNNSGVDLTVGGSYKSGWPRAQRVLLPENNLIAHNLISKTGGVAVSLTTPDKSPPLDAIKFAGNSYEGNVISGGTVQAETVPDGLTVAELELTRGPDGLLRPTEPQLARAAPGAASFFTGAASPFHPLTPAEVGPDWVKEQRKAGDPLFP